ncbi:hypothetical protein LHV13_08255 [Ferrovum sp. PN-J185]|uniref:hypothetical protein n=1 Tax=Ferrovum sp. PN-J185 TaxID=1356306 RepID=UPI000799FBDE|nr:hypothetical protein [Ferrovum sp. PN-J185]KXW56965.1 primosomal replication protein n [Ferrovum sp. PN-J185]MCC6069162.1 hypothetical protein [Ferrovum sp. PN-J185]MDE1892386.1 hypothetical protein [Betaproteobacteria bacterium]MDE2057127.1 hypothetical protein [Betaproteobacteria bacterium]
MRNEVVLEGVLQSQESLRYTPAGVASFVGVLLHKIGDRETEYSNASLNVIVTAYAEQALALSQLVFPTTVVVKGQLIKKHANSKELVIKVNQFKLSNGV